MAVAVGGVRAGKGYSDGKHWVGKAVLMADLIWCFFRKYPRT